MKYDLGKLDGLGYKLGINDSFLHTDCQGVFSMDRTWIEKRLHHLKKADIMCYFSRKHFSKAFGEPWPKVTLLPVAIDSKGLCLQPGKLNAKNSGAGGLNLGYHWAPENIFLFGFDLNLGKHQEEHWYKDYEWRRKKEHNGLYHSWIHDHTLAAVQLQQAKIKVYNVSRESKILCYQKIEFADVFKYL